VTGLVEWYNNEHRSSAIQIVTPTQRHEGLDETLLQRQKVVYETALARNPQRWSGTTRNWQRAHAVQLNPDKDDTDHKPITKERIQNKNAA
jgi:putative transposase